MGHRICPWWMGYWLASRWRRLIQNPSVILAPLVSEGMIVLEPGPGMGAFTLELARRVGPKGRVIAVDIQPKMLEVLVRRASKAGLAGWIEARQPKGDHLGVEDFQGRVDFALAFAMVHEVPKPELLFGDIRAALKGGGKLLLAEPCGHVKAKAFEATMDLARKSGFVLESRPAIRWNHSALLTRA